MTWGGRSGNIARIAGSYQEETNFRPREVESDLITERTGYIAYLMILEDNAFTLVTSHVQFFFTVRIHQGYFSGDGHVPACVVGMAHCDNFSDNRPRESLG